MENSWQVKCSIPWPSASLSPQFQSQSSRNQIDMTAGQYMHPFAAHETGSIERAIRQEPTAFGPLNLGSVKSGKTELGNSFLALLSGPSHQLHFEYQQLLNSRPVSATNLPIHDSTVVSGPNPGVSGPLISSLTQCHGNESMGNGAASTCSRVALSHDNIQMSGLHFHGSDSTKQSLQHAVHSNGTGMESSSLRWGWLTNTIPSSTKQLHAINFEASPKISQEAKFSIPDLTSSSTRGHPRVFCLNTGGDLLLSDIGRLGVVCLCHNFHMSVANFCEHSGSCAVNPGDAVRLESGETIGQWRKLHFTKFGLRVPDDNIGWDWADGSSAVSESAKHKATTAQCISKNSCIFQPVDPFGGRSRFDHHLNDLGSPNNPYTGQPVLENPAKKITQNSRQRNSLEGRNALLKNFVGTSHGVLPTLVDNQTIQTLPKIAFDNGRKNCGYQSNAQYIDSINKGENPFFSNQNLGSIISFDKSADVSRCNNSRETFMMDRDSVHSNIELRLGQPSQPSHTIVGSIPSSIRHQGISTLSDPHSSQFYGQLIQRAVNPRVTEESRRNLRYAPPDSLVTKQREKESQSNLMSHALRSLNASLDQFKGDAAASSLTSMFLSPSGHLSSTLEGTISSQATDNNISNRENLMPRIFSGDSHLVKSGLADFPRNIIDGMERKLEIQGLGLSNHFDFGKGSGALTDSSSYSSADPVLHRPTNSALSSSYVSASLPSPTSVNFSATNPFFPSNLTSVLQNKKSIDLGHHLFDENLRLLALRHFVEMSKQEHAMAGMNQDQGRLHCPLGFQMQKRASKETLVTSELRQGPCTTGTHDTPEVALGTLQSCCNHCLGGSFEKLTCRIGSNKSCSFATSTPGMLLHSKEIEVQKSSCHVRGVDEQPLLRLGRSTNNCTNDFGECVRCSHKEPNPCFIGNCACAVHSKRLTGSCISRMENLADASKENIGSIVSKTSNLLASPADKDNLSPKGKKNLPDTCESLERHDLMKSGCHSLQWRELPSKVTENCEATCVERPEVVTSAKERIEDQLADTAAKGSNGTLQETESLKEQQMSNICSAGSTPALTEFSVEGLKNDDSSTVDARKMRFMQTLVVDEGSGIEKCCSSDDAPDSGRWAETPASTGNIESSLPNQSSCDLNGKPNLANSVKLKKVKSRISTGVRAGINFQQVVRDSKTEKKKRVIKWKRLDATLPSSDIPSRKYNPPNYSRYSELHFNSCRGVEKPLQIALGKQKSCCTYATGSSSFKRKRSTLSSANVLSRKSNLQGFDRGSVEWGDVDQTQSSGSDHMLKMRKPRSEMKAKRVFSKDAGEHLPEHEVNHIDHGKASKYDTVSCSNSEHFYAQGVGTRDRHTRPIVCDNYGIITDGKSGSLPKPAKIVSLSSILKNSVRCSTIGNKKEEVARVLPVLETTEACFNGNEGWYDDDGSHIPSKNSISQRCSSARLKPSMHVSKETRKRSLYELTRKAEHVEKLACISYLEKEQSQSMEETWSTAILPQNVLADASNGKKSSSSKSYSRKASKYMQHTDVKSSVRSCLKNVDDSKGHIGETLRVNDKRYVIKGRKCRTFLLDADAFCCVCGSSNKDDFNRLLECSHCLIRVHQACYGVSKVPKGRWSCRPCRTNFENIVCVLCGYKGGAMTQALRSREIVRSLLQEWKIQSGSMSFAHLSETSQDELNLLNATSRDEASPDAVPITRIRNIDAFHGVAVRLNLQGHANSARNSNNLGDCLQVHNTITAGILDPSVKQWVHMVCGLWMPGTRCPNVDTMSAFDVSGVSRARKNVVCSICNRRGGSCIQCRVADCSVRFHPWCAHQKGLLQSEIEGIDNEKVGFYGRCVLHATYSGCFPGDVHLMDSKLVETLENRESTCARTEGYKGRKREQGFRLNLHGQFSNGGGCLVPQEQINAWLHINGQKSSTRGPVKPLASDIEYDCRQEYARYKQAKGWKHLVVYKSGIHALGLYTSQFISRGAMVVEYVGEIVGLRVADKREAEYHSGRRVQYKSACYFFRIDKEHIIDATRKGGIARFVNHSCLPNCVAKVISVRNEKKVVFFAERDINPGEEITYDYNFNHEDEGKKIPCFCNSKNCRRYLN